MIYLSTPTIHNPLLSVLSAVCLFGLGVFGVVFTCLFIYSLFIRFGVCGGGERGGGAGRLFVACRCLFELSAVCLFAGVVLC